MISTLFSYLDSFLSVALPVPVRVVVWAAVSGLLSMWIYAVCSPQQRLRELQEQSTRLQKQLSAYDGEFKGAMALVRQNLALSMRRLGWALGPALLAGLPVLLVLLWMASDYAAALPQPGEAVTVRVEPADAVVDWEPSGGATRGEVAGTWLVEWPVPGEPLTMRNAAGARLLQFPLDVAQPAVTPRAWWSFLFGSRAGYLPDQAGVVRVELDLPPLEIHTYGPAWARTWLSIFLLATSVAARL